MVNSSKCSAKARWIRTQQNAEFWVLRKSAMVEPGSFTELIKEALSISHPRGLRGRQHMMTYTGCFPLGLRSEQCVSAIAVHFVGLEMILAPSWTLILPVLICMLVSPDSKVPGANMGPIWGRQDPGGPHVGPRNFAFWDHFCQSIHFTLTVCPI